MGVTGVTKVVSAVTSCDYLRDSWIRDVKFCIVLLLSIQIEEEFQKIFRNWSYYYFKDLFFLELLPRYFFLFYAIFTK